MILLEAVNAGGGVAILLQYLATELDRKNIPFYVLSSDTVPHLGQNHKRVDKTSPISRRRHSLLSKTCEEIKADHVLCFGNVPPLSPLRGPTVTTYFHNALLLKKHLPKGLGVLLDVKFRLLRLLIHRLRRNTHNWVFQTPYISSQFCTEYQVTPEQCHIYPFFNRIEYRDDVNSKSQNDLESDFFYNSNAFPHKNHRNLLLAMLDLAQRGVYPKLTLTIDAFENRKYNQLIERCRSAGANIICLGTVPHSMAIATTRATRAVVFPSLIETLGLGLLEAATLKKPVIAGESTWIHDVITPSLTFDANNPRSIADAMLSALKSTLPSAVSRIDNRIDEFINWLVTQRRQSTQA